MIDINLLNDDSAKDAIVDIGTGYAINYPLGWQDYPGWQLDRPEIIDRINQMRVQMGIYVANDFFTIPDLTVYAEYVNILEQEVERRGLASRVEEIMDMKRRAKMRSGE
jgi:hypothetical protein